MPPDRCWDVLERVIFVESQLFAAAAGVPSIDNHSILPRSWVLFVAGGAEYGRHATCSLRFCWRPGNPQARSAQRPALLGRLARLVVLARSLMLSIPGWLDWRFFLSRMRFRQLFCGVSTSPYVAFMLGKPLRTLLALPKNMEPMTMTTTQKFTRVNWQFTSLRVLATEWVDGLKITEQPKAVKPAHVGVGVEAFAAAWPPGGFPSLLIFVDLWATMKPWKIGKWALFEGDSVGESGLKLLINSGLTLGACGVVVSFLSGRRTERKSDQISPENPRDKVGPPSIR